MGGWGSSGGSKPKAKAKPLLTTAPSLATVSGKGYGISTEFAADDPVRLPSQSDSSLLAAARLRRELLARSGRDSTRLVGTGVYGNTFLGSVT